MLWLSAAATVVIVVFTVVVVVVASFSGTNQSLAHFRSSHLRLMSTESRQPLAIQLQLLSKQATAATDDDDDF